MPKFTVIVIAISTILLIQHQALSQLPNEVARVLDGGGGASSNEFVRAYASIFQPNPVGFSSNEKYLNSAGFLHSDTIVSSSTADSDNDGISDWYEITGILSDPDTPTHTQLDDTDNDGVSDNEEIASGTNPTDPNSQLEIVSTYAVGDGVEVMWKARGGRNYKLWSADTVPDLHTNPTLVVQSTASGGSGPWNSTMMVYSNESTARRFYKVQTP